jgi:galactose mutarotase-like enzyme
MKIWRGVYKGLDAFFIESELIKLTVLKDLGAKIASLIYKEQDFEVATQPNSSSYTLPRFGDSFEKYDGSGFDDCFPTTDPCLDMVDHGELWSRPWDIEVVNGSLVCKIEGVRFPYRFERTIQVEESTVNLKYRVENFGEKPINALWAFHGLVRGDKDSRIIIPGVEKVINVHKSERLGDIGTVHNFPETLLADGTPLRLDRFNPFSKRNEKYYAYGRLKIGEAALTLNHRKLQYKLTFPEDVVPYLGVWLDEGGLRSDGAIALEPTTAFYDSPYIAEEKGDIQPISPVKTLSWTLKISLKPLD